MLRSALLLLSLASVSLAACSLMLGEGFSGGESDAAPPDGESDAAIDASPVSEDASDRDAPVTPVDAGDSGVIYREDFEQGCGTWRLDEVALSTVAGHTGQGCRMCTVPASANDIAIEKNLAGPKPNETYVLELWMRRGTTGPQNLYVALESEIPGANKTDHIETALVGDWQKVTVKHTTVVDLEYLVVYLGAKDAEMNDCIDIDELVVTRQ